MRYNNIVFYVYSAFVLLFYFGNIYGRITALFPGNKKQKKDIIMEFQSIHLPTIGKRTLKTMLSVGIIILVYTLLDRNPCFACIGAVFGMGNKWAPACRQAETAVSAP